MDIGKLVGAGPNMDGVGGFKPHEGVAFEMTNGGKDQKF